MGKGKGSVKKTRKGGKNSPKTRGKGDATVSKHETNGTWRVRCTHYPKSYASGNRKEAGGYQTEQQAKAEVQLFAFAVKNGGAKNWENWDSAASDAVNKKRNKAYSASFSKQTSDASNPTENKGDTVLNGADKKRLKRLRRSGNTNLSRVVYNAFMVASDNNSEEDMMRGILALHGNKIDRMSRSFEDRTRYLKERLKKLAEMIVEEKRKSALLLRRIGEGRTNALMIRGDEKIPRPEDTIKCGDFSEKQMSHVFNQALATQSCIEKRIERLEAEEVLIQQWQTTADLAMQVGEKEASLNTLMEKCTELKVSRSVLKLVKEVCEETKVFNFKPTTILSWWQEFNKLGGVGFNEDGRGKSKKYNWLEDWELTSTLALYLATEKKISVSAVGDFLNGKVKEMYGANPRKYETEVEVNGEKKWVLKKIVCRCLSQLTLLKYYMLVITEQNSCHMQHTTLLKKNLQGVPPSIGGY
jgi:hypothetical protein